MVEVEFRFPSAQSYAYVGVKGTPEEIAQIDYEMLASLYANSLYAFGKTERQAIDLIAGGGTGLVPPKAQAPASKPVSRPVAQESAPNADAAETVTEGLGATEIQDVNEAPYKQPAKAAKPKAWESKKPKPTATLDLPDW